MGRSKKNMTGCATPTISFGVGKMSTLPYSGVGRAGPMTG